LANKIIVKNFGVFINDRAPFAERIINGKDKSKGYKVKLPVNEAGIGKISKEISKNFSKNLLFFKNISFNPKIIKIISVQYIIP